MRKYNIEPVSTEIENKLRQKIDRKTKPLGSLGVLEEIALRIGLIQNSLTPCLKNPTILVFAADHGITNEGVSAYPKEVTWQMVMNFLNGGAAINIFCKQHKINLNVVDAGVDHDFPHETPRLIRNKAGRSTENFLKRPAMTVKQAQHCIESSADIVSDICKAGCNVIGFGEMGIGNTSSASALMSVMCGIPVADCVGRGTGLDDQRVKHKQDVLGQAIAHHGLQDSVVKKLATYGGFEIAQIAGGILQAAERRMVILIDGFISTAGYLIAHAIDPRVKPYCLFSHQSSEQAHQLLLNHLDVKPILNLGMRLGEGTGVAVCFPVIQSAINFLNEMASFESASVSDKK